VHHGGQENVDHRAGQRKGKAPAQARLIPELRRLGYRIELAASPSPA
jgi:hypothetical protein